MILFNTAAGFIYKFAGILLIKLSAPFQGFFLVLPEEVGNDNLGRRTDHAVTEISGYSEHHHEKKGKQYVYFVRNKCFHGKFSIIV